MSKTCFTENKCYSCNVSEIYLFLKILGLGVGFSCSFSLRTCLPWDLCCDGRRCPPEGRVQRVRDLLCSWTLEAPGTVGLLDCRYKWERPEVYGVNLRI